MNDLYALQPIGMILAMTPLLLLVLAGLSAAERDDWLIPSPEGSASQFVQALGAHRYTGAMNQLSESLTQNIERTDLQELVLSIEESSLEGIEDAHEVNADENGDRATAQVQVKFANLQKQMVELSLVKESGLWKVDSLAPLESLTGN